LGNTNYGEWSIRMEAELIRKGLWDMVFAEVDVDGKTDDETLAQVHRACGLGTRMALRWKLLTATKGMGEAMSAWISRVKGMALDLEDIGVTVDDEDRILALTTGLDKLYDSFVISLDSTATADLTFDHVVNCLLNEDVRR
ncbi:uncharacterized protein EDB93DRAFT_1070697, partial [Suillus bovinus]|uniref:uncharacterized protein n=1 Tax=Suillus bovinus TaxID=48563 RepID=UPI001B862913